jgi:hypothetical protein
MTLTNDRWVPNSKYDRKVAAPDWAKVQEIYAFCRARAIDRIATEGQSLGATSLDKFRDLRTLETMYAKARRHGAVVTSCAVTYFTMTALKDAQHPEFRAEWPHSAPTNHGEDDRT